MFTRNMCKLCTCTFGPLLLLCMDLGFSISGCRLGSVPNFHITSPLFYFFPISPDDLKQVFYNRVDLQTIASPPPFSVYLNCGH